MSGDSWAGKHKAELLAAAAVSAAAFTGGTSLGLLGADAAGAAGAGAGAFGADAAVGAGMGGSAASAFAPTAAQAAISGLGGASAATPALSGIASDAAAGGGLLSAAPAAGMPELAMNGGGANPGMLAYLRGAGVNLVGGPDNFDAVSKGAEKFGKASFALSRAGLLTQPQPMPAPQIQRSQQPSQAPGVDSFSQMYGQPVIDAETRRRMLAMQQGGGNGYF